MATPLYEEEGTNQAYIDRIKDQLGRKKKKEDTNLDIFECLMFLKLVFL